MSTTFSQEAYLIKTIEILKKPHLSTSELQEIINKEKMFKGHENILFAEQYKSIFSLLRDRVIVPNAGKLELVDIFEEFSILLRNSCIQMGRSDEGMSRAEALICQMPKNEIHWQYRMVRMAMVIQTFNGNDWKEDFLKNLFFLPSSACFSNVQDAHKIAVVLRNIFRSCFDLMKTAEKCVFDKEFISKDLLAQRSAFMWILEVVWNIVYKESPEHMEIISRWFEIFHEAIAADNRELVFYMHNPLSHIYLNMCHKQEEFKRFNDEVEMPLSKYIQKNMRKWGHKPVKKKMEHCEKYRVAFIYDRIVGNSPVKLLLSLLANLKDEVEIELFVYDMGYVEKAQSDPKMVQSIIDMGVVYVNNHELMQGCLNGHHYSHYEKAVKLREQALADKINIIVTTGNRLFSGFLLATRTAPMQIYWDHGNHEYNVMNIDKRMIHFRDSYTLPYAYEHIALKLLDKYLLYDVLISLERAEKIKAKLPKHKVVAGSIGRLMKLSEQYLDTVEDIMHSNPDIIYLACGSGNIERLRKKLKEKNLTERFIFTGWINPNVYGYVIDIYLNTFPLEGGESVNEFIIKDKVKNNPLVTSSDKYVVQMENAAQSYSDNDINGYKETADVVIEMCRNREVKPQKDKLCVTVSTDFAELYSAVVSRLGDLADKLIISNEIKELMKGNIHVCIKKNKVLTHIAHRNKSIILDLGSHGKGVDNLLSGILKDVGPRSLGNLNKQDNPVSDKNELFTLLFGRYINDKDKEKLWGFDGSGSVFILSLIEVLSSNHKLMQSLSEFYLLLDDYKKHGFKPFNYRKAAVRHFKKIAEIDSGK